MFAQAMQALVLVATSLVASDDSMSNERLEAMLAQGDAQMVKAVFRRNEDEVLDFIDGYLEGGLKAIEEGSGSAEATTQAMAKFRTAIRFAELADEALMGAEFANYAASFASWSPQEQKQFREGQAAYKAGRQAKDDPAKAISEHRRAAEIAQGLGDGYGAAMAYGGVAAAELQRGNHEAVADAARIANDFNTKLRRRQASIRVLVIWGESIAAQGGRGGGMNMYNHAWTMLKPSDPKELRETVYNRMVEALAKSGDVAKLAEIKRRYEVQFGVTPEEAPPPATP